MENEIYESHEYKRGDMHFPLTKTLMEESWPLESLVAEKCLQQGSKAHVVDHTMFSPTFKLTPLLDILVDKDRTVQIAYHEASYKNIAY